MNTESSRKQHKVIASELSFSFPPLNVRDITLGLSVHHSCLSLPCAGVSGLSHHSQPEETVDGHSSRALSYTSGSGLRALGRLNLIGAIKGAFHTGKLSLRLGKHLKCCKWPAVGLWSSRRVPHDTAPALRSHPRHWLPGLSEGTSHC